MVFIDNRVLVRLSQKQNNVVPACHGKGLADSRRAVRRKEQVHAVLLAGLARAHGNLLQERHAVFTARILVSQNHHITETRRDFTLQRALLYVALAA